MNHIGTQPLATRRLVLRRFTPADAEAMYSTWASDAEVTRWLRWQPHQSPAETRALLQDWERSYAQSNYYHWGMVLKENGALIGAIAVMPGHDGIPEGSWEPGYAIGRAYWGQGYTTEALCAVMEYFTAGTGVRQLHCCHAVANPASGRVMEKAGFVYTHNGVYHKPDGTEIPARYYLWRAEGAADDTNP